LIIPRAFRTGNAVPDAPAAAGQARPAGAIPALRWIATASHGFPSIPMKSNSPENQNGSRPMKRRQRVALALATFVMLLVGVLRPLGAQQENFVSSLIQQ